MVKHVPFPANLFLLTLAVSTVILPGPLLASDSTLTVTGHHQVRVPPDQVSLILRIEQRQRSLKDGQPSDDLRELRKHLDRQSNQLTKALLDRPYLSDTDIETLNVRIQPWHERTASSRKQVGWTGEHVLRVRTDRIRRVSDILAVAFNNGATSTGQLTFSLRDSTEANAQKRALRQSVRAAREKAVAMADAAGVHLGSMISLQEENHSNRPIARTEQFAAQADRSSIQPPATLAVEAEVTMTFSVKSRTK